MGSTRRPPHGASSPQQLSLPWFDGEAAAPERDAAPAAFPTRIRPPETFPTVPVAPSHPVAGLPAHPAGQPSSDPPTDPSPGRVAGVAVPRPPTGTAPAVTPPAAVPGVEVSFIHPQADREIRFGSVRVAYALTRARRRSIGMVVSAEGLSVRAPRWTGLGEIEAALHEKARWICAKLAEQRERARRLEAARIDWRDGTHLPFLGEKVIVVLDPRITGAVLHADAPALPGVACAALHLGLPQQADPAQIRDAVQSWLQRQARRLFAERCAHFAERLNVRVSRIALSNAQTRWGSASADGVIRLNWRLIHFGLPTIDYVVAHELAHLREMNHSPRFWKVVRSVIPDLEQARERLKQEVVPDLGD